MKEEFRGYYRPTDEEFATLWQQATISLDANVLLNLYGYSATTRAEVIELLASIKTRIWIPYQFAREYHRNRPRAISEQVSSYADALKAIRELLDQKLKPTHRHPFVTQRSMRDLERICKELEAGKQEYDKLFSDDPYFGKVSEILSTRIGAQPSPEVHARICLDGQKRYAQKAPPGFADAAKPEPDRYGDLLGWMEILEFGKNQQAPLILVTDDKKDDWWHMYGKDRRLGPRPELIAEYWLTCEQQFYMYSLAEFLRLSQERLGQAVTNAAIEEVTERSVETASTVSIDKAVAPDSSQGFLVRELQPPDEPKQGVSKASLPKVSVKATNPKQEPPKKANEN